MDGQLLGSRPGTALTFTETWLRRFFFVIFSANVMLFGRTALLQNKRCVFLLPFPGTAAGETALMVVGVEQYVVVFIAGVFLGKLAV